MAEMIVSTIGSVAGIREGWKSEACRLFSLSTGASPVPTLPLPRHLFATGESGSACQRRVRSVLLVYRRKLTTLRRRVKPAKRSTRPASPTANSSGSALPDRPVEGIPGVVPAASTVMCPLMPMSS